MCLKQIQDSIKLSIQVITKALKQVPSDKRSMLFGRVNNLLTKNKQIMQQNTDAVKLKQFQKQLEFNLNFIKLSHPNIDYTPEQIVEPSNRTNNQQGQQKKQQVVDHKFKVINNDNIEIQRLNTNDTLDGQLERQKNVREEVQFSNWFDGNVDPELLRKHKQLLQRQHFRGDHWKQKQVPEFFAKTYLESLIAQKELQGNVQPVKKTQEMPDYMPKDIDKSQELWEKVKR